MAPFTPLIVKKTDSKTCPHCKRTFECSAALTVPCNCTTVRVSKATSDYIKQLGYTDCLCNKCLIEIENQIAAAQAH